MNWPWSSALNLTAYLPDKIGVAGVRRYREREILLYQTRWLEEGRWPRRVHAQHEVEWYHAEDRKTKISACASIRNDRDAGFLFSEGVE